MVIELLAGNMRRGRGGIAAVEDDMRQTYTVKYIRKGLTLLTNAVSAGQCKYTQNYSLYVQTSDAVGEPVDLEKEAMGVISPKLVPKLAKNSGLAKAEYEHLLATPFAEDCTRLILRGLERRFCTSTRKARISR